MLKILSIAPFLRNPLVKAIEKDPDPINQARLVMIIYAIISGTTLCFILGPAYIMLGQKLQFIRVIIVIVFLISILKLLSVKPAWKEASHVLQIVLGLVIWSNVFIFIQTINILTLQYALISLIFGFYVLGLRWGLFYGIINFIPVLFIVEATTHNNTQFLITPRQVGDPIFYIILCHNFFLIVFAHFHFFRAFQKSITGLSIAGNNQRLLNERLQEAMAKVEESSKIKLDFLSTMSHELRTPLNGVIGMTNILLLADPREEQKENLDILKFSASNLLTLVNDVLDFNKIGSDKVTLESIDFNLTELMQNCCASLSLKAKEKGIKFELLVDPILSVKMVTGDPTRLSQIISNLVSNAVKFTSQGAVTVNLSVINILNNTVKIHFSIKDTGIGIPEDKQAVIFEPFMQASKNTTRKYGGTGLGLSIVKLLLELNKSTISFTSTPGEGTEFLFDLTLGSPDNDMSLIEDKKSKTPNDLSKLKVLIAEDNMINILFMEKLFFHWKIEPIIAENGQEAVDLLSRQDFDVVLMDIDMPVLDGYEATAIIRAMTDKKKSDIHIIALTASVGYQARETVMKAGLDDYLEKPFDLDDLREKLENINFIKASAETVIN